MLKNVPNTTRSEIVAILEDADGLFWVGSQTGLSIFNKANTTLTLVKNIELLNQFENGNIKVLFEDSQKNVWIVTTKGLYVYAKKQIHCAPLNYLRVAIV